jgi:hypothetical protein
LNSLEWLEDTVEDVFVLLKSNDMASKLPACMDRSPCCGGKILAKWKKIKTLKLKIMICWQVNKDIPTPALTSTTTCPISVVAIIKEEMKAISFSRAPRQALELSMRGVVV